MLKMPLINSIPSLPVIPGISSFLKLFKINKQKKLYPQPKIIQTEVLRNTFVKHLLSHNNLRAYLESGEILTVFATSYDKINNQLVVSDQAENGLLYLEKGAKVEFFTDLNDTHEYFSFVSKVVKIKVKGVKLTYYMSVPKVLNKSRRRVIPRVAVKNHSIIRLDGSSFSGNIIDLSVNGIALAIKGYYPIPLAVGDILDKCNIDIFQPRHNDNISFNCSISVRRVDFQSKPEPITIIAGIFYNHDIHVEKKLYTYLQQSA